MDEDFDAMTIFDKPNDGLGRFVPLYWYLNRWVSKAVPQKPREERLKDIIALLTRQPTAPHRRHWFYEGCWPWTAVYREEGNRSGKKNWCWPWTAVYRNRAHRQTEET